MSYTIGLDFGTRSVRAVILDEDGRERGDAERAYAVYETLPRGSALLKPRMVLADPEEYLDAMAGAVREAVLRAGVRGSEAVGIAADATSCTLAALDADGRPLCRDPAFRGEAGAYLKLWKSRSAQAETDCLQRAAEERGEDFLPWVGGRISSEWLVPKALETFRESPGVFAAAASLMDLPDWITMVLCGEATRNLGSLAFKTLAPAGRLPSAAYLERAEKGFGALREKLRGRPVRWGDRAGGLTAAAASRLGLPAGIAVGGGMLDGDIPVVSLGLCGDGDALLTLGTSGVLAALGDRARPLKGIAGGAMDAFLAGRYGCEAGIAAMGDLYGWAVERAATAADGEQARREGVSLHELLTRRSLERPPREDDLLALDWWNGHRGPLAHGDVTGVLVGLRLTSDSADLYRALLEATAFGVRMNLENMEKQGLAIRRLAVGGGIARKNAALVQLMSDVLDRELLFSEEKYEAAAGAAIVAANAARTGDCRTLADTALAMARPFDRVFVPRPERTKLYDARYRRYVRLAGLMQDYETGTD